jgi:hypothetical protein
MSSNYLKEEISLEVHKLVNHCSDLAYVNRMTGLWDHKRGELCRIENLLSSTVEQIAETERKSRYFVEKRALHRTEIDGIIMRLVHLGQH